MYSLEKSKNFVADLVAIMKSRFPNSNIVFKKVSMFDVNEYQIRFYLSANIDECSNKIEMNDAMRWLFVIPCDEVGCLFDNIVIELDNNSIIRIADKTNEREKYCVYGRVKVPYRKIQGTDLSCLLKMRKFIDKVAETMLANAEVINQGIIKGLFTVEDKVRQ